MKNTSIIKYGTNLDYKSKSQCIRQCLEYLCENPNSVRTKQLTLDTTQYINYVCLLLS